MKRHFKILVVFFLVLLVTSCQSENYTEINRTHKPSLEVAPVNGTWEFVKSLDDNKTNFKPGDLFHLDINLFASKDNIYLNPDFEVLRLDLDKYLYSRNISPSVKSSLNEKEISVIEIIKEGQLIAELIALEKDRMVLNISNNLLEIKRVSNKLSKEEIEELKSHYSEEEKVYQSSNTWAVALGLRLQGLENNGGKNSGSSSYASLVFISKDGKLSTKFVNGLLVKHADSLDRISVQRVEENGQEKYFLNLNNKEVPINNVREETKENLFRIVFLSDKYISLEYINPGQNLNTWATYSTSSKLGFNQIKIDDIAQYSYDKVLDAIISLGSNATFKESIYNIALGRENGMTVLKGRIPYIINGKKMNRDYIVSSRFTYADQGYQKFDLQNLAKIFTNVEDAVPTPSNDYGILLFKDSFQLYKIDQASRKYEKALEKKIEYPYYLVSITMLEGEDLNLLKAYELKDNLK